MTPIPTDWALHTTCIAADFVHQLFACHVGDRQPLASPPLALDVPTMLACRQLARVLADAYANPIQLDLDMIRYNEALDKRSTGRITKHEDALLQKFPCSSQQLLEKPSVLMDSGGHIILWYLPDTISPWIQAEMAAATVGMGYLLKTSITSGQESNWRTFSGHFHMSDCHLLTPGCINIAPCWFQQGREPYGFPPTGGFTPEVSAMLKGEGGPKVILSMQRSALLASAALRVMHPELYWALVTTQMKLARWAMENELDGMQCPLHRDPRSTPEGFDVMTSVGHYCDGLMTLSNLGIQLRYNSSAMVGCSGHIVRHGVTFRGDRFMWAWFMRDSLHNFVGTPRSEYAKYKDVDWDVSVSA
ncbi:uncharacterized protein EDB91DRAFT_1252759 [Suillus paluster]|uniref:uncharacterized protein n=1 Tax=Suillus paluster TaxID=48578 RepID=UPI001B875AB3|nr:uncharacterized protein EDB91DRAFT_1252759 [Suillus paluster]KAG1730099.1 hypothetical protein EDB91DRAFT_1252759 [Suillus paluster]